jgi:hypothetical protein
VGPLTELTEGASSVSNSAVLAAALAWLRLGVAVVPVHDRGPGRLVPGIAWERKGPLRSQGEVGDYWRTHPDAQLAVYLDNSEWGGPRLGCIDDDSGKHDHRDHERPLPLGGYRETTRSGGTHDFFRYTTNLPPDLRSRVVGVGGFVDVLVGGIVYVAPSENRGRGSYAVMTPLEQGIPEFSSVGLALDRAAPWLRSEWLARARGGGDGVPGDRTGRSGHFADPSECYRVAVRAVARGATDGEVRSAVGCDHPEWAPDNIHRTVERIRRWLAAHPRRGGSSGDAGASPPQPKRKLPTGNEVAWSVPGDGEKTDDLCGTMSHYAHRNGDGGKDYRTAPHSCNRRECPICYGRAAHREGHAAERQVYAQVHPAAAEVQTGHQEAPKAERWERRPYHVVIRPPAGTIENVLSDGEYTRDVRPKAYRKARGHGVTGGGMVLHVTPIPAFHAIGFIRGNHPISGGPDKDGWTVETTAIRGSVYVLLRWMYMLAAVPYTTREVTLAQGAPTGAPGAPPPSAKVTYHVHSVTWFGDLSYASRDGVVPVPKGVVCEVCRRFVPFGLWVRLIWVGKGPPPRGHGVCKDDEWVEDPLAPGGSADETPRSGSETERAVYRLGPNILYPDGTVASRTTGLVLARRRSDRRGFDRVEYQADYREELRP